MGKRKYDPCYKWDGDPEVEDDFASSGDLGMSGLLRALIKALEVQWRGFAHWHEKHHSEPMVKAIDLVQLFLGDGSSIKSQLSGVKYLVSGLKYQHESNTIEARV